jgi:hypothetical protein
MQLGCSGIFVASVARPKAHEAEETRTRGFATPAFAGCALVAVFEGEIRCGTTAVKSLRLVERRLCWLTLLVGASAPRPAH